MRRIGLSIACVSLAALVFSCSSDDADSVAGSGGANGVDGGGATTGAGATTAGVGGAGQVNPGAGGAGQVNPAAGGAGQVNPAAGGAGQVNPAAGGAGQVIPGAGGAAPGVGGAAPGVGGAVAGVGGGTSPVRDPKPSLVTSSEGSFWNVGEVTAGGTAATITVTTATKGQVWHGFGGTFNEHGWDVLSLLSAEDRALAMTLLFDLNNGIGLDWGRIPMGPSDYALTRYTLSSGPGEFDLTHDQSYLIPYIQAAQAIKGDVKYWASPWTPPPWAKVAFDASHPLENDGYDKGIFNTAYYQEYADYFVAWIQAYEAAGIPINSVMPQNEPGWAQGYPTASFGPARDTVASENLVSDVTLGTFVDGYLFPTIEAAGLTTQVWFGTLSNNDYFGDYWNDMKSKASASKIVGVGLQWATQPNVASIAGDGYLVMQSEHKCGNYPWGKGAEIADYVTHKEDQPEGDTAPNDYNYGQESWDLMKSWIDDGVNIYSAWNMVLDTGGANLDLVRRWHQNSLLVVDRASGSLTVTPYYYVFRHIAQYVDVGATLVGVDGDALAFQNPDGSVMTVIFNSGAAAAETTLSVDGNMVTFTVPARGWATVNM